MARADGVIRLEHCDVSVTIGGTAYSFEDVSAVALADTETHTKVRGINNSKDTKGINVKSGLADPGTITLTLVGVTQALKNLLNATFDNDEDVGLSVVDRNGGGSIVRDNASLNTRVYQAGLSEGADELTITVTFNVYFLGL
jgi:hypothetical protein